MALTCTEDENQKLVWMDTATSERLKAERAAAEAETARAAAAVEQEAQRLAAEQQAAAEEAQRIANEQAAAAAAAAEAQRLAEEQARQAPVVLPPAPPAAPAYYKNCDAARAAGAAPVYACQPGYGRHLDRDGDGVGCE